MMTQAVHARSSMYSRVKSYEQHKVHTQRQVESKEKNKQIFIKNIKTKSRPLVHIKYIQKLKPYHSREQAEKALTKFQAPPSEKKAQLKKIFLKKITRPKHDIPSFAKRMVYTKGRTLF